jgi:alpha-tubulin suppressor-like RCC1 family protein
MNFEKDRESRQDVPLLISKKFVYDTDPVIQISTGMDHSAFLTKSGKAYIWGRNIEYQITDENWNHPIYPILQNIDNKPDIIIKKIELTNNTSYALTNEGHLYARGAKTIQSNKKSQIVNNFKTWTRV